MFEMALERYYDSNFHLVGTSAGFLQSSSSDNSLQEHEQYQDAAAAASLLNVSAENFPSSNPRISNLNVGIVPVDTNHAIVLNSRASSLVTDATFAFSESPNMYRNAIPIVHSDPNLLALPSSMTVDVVCIEQQNSHLGPKRPQVAKGKQQHQKGFIAMSPESQKHQNLLLSGLKQDPIKLNKRYKKPRLDINEEATPDQYISQHLEQSRETVQLQTHAQTHQLSGLIQHHMNPRPNEQTVPHSVPPPQLHRVLNQLPNREMRNQQQQPVVHQLPNAHRFDEGVCTRRLMQYIHHLRHRPRDNNLAYWRRFVMEYFAPGAKKRWCVSLYDKVGLEAMSIFRNAATDGWQCDLCGCKSGRGFEANFEAFPRLNKLEFESGVLDELLFLDLPQEHGFPSGLMMLKCGKAVQESVHENLRVVRQGQLCIVFTHDLKILSWEFCASSHEVFLPRSLVVSQVVQATQKYQRSINHDGSNGFLPQLLQPNGNHRIQAAGSWLANVLDSQPVDNLGFSKRYTRCLQMAEIVHNLKDLMNFSLSNHLGPIESLNNYCRDIATSKLQMAELQEHLQCQNLPTEMSLPAFPVTGVNASIGSNMARGSLMAASESATSTMADYNYKLVRQRMLDFCSLYGETSITSNQKASSEPYQAYQGPKISSPSLTENLTATSTSPSPKSGQTTEQCVIRKILHEMLNRKANEDPRPVTSLPTRTYYNSTEATSTLGNLLASTSNSWASYNVSFSESAASDPSSREDQI